MARESSQSIWLAAALCGGAACCLTLAAGCLGIGDAPPPLVWSDVALVSFLAGLPLATWIAIEVRSKFGRWGLVLMTGLAGLGSTAWLLPSPELWLQSSAWLLSIARAGIGATLAAAAVGGLLLVSRRPVIRPPQSAAARLALALACLVLLPWLYVQDRCRRDVARVAAYWREARIGESHRLAQRLLGLAPDASVGAIPLRQAAAELQRAEAELQIRVNRPLAAASDIDLLRRSQDLAMLGQTAEALAVLEASSTLTHSVAGSQLRGIILKSTEQYGPALEALGWAKAASLAESPSAEQRADLINLTREIASCQRKLGRYADAERTYRELVELSPTAATHFLLAQFYSDAQQATAAQQHAARAMALDPSNYGVPGQRLIDELITHQFGCWGVFIGERQAASGQP